MLTELEQRANDEVRHARRELVEKMMDETEHPKGETDGETPAAVD